MIADSGLVPVTVEGWGKPAWADPAALATAPRGRHRTTLLSPFDSLVWERARTERIFGFTHRLEAYVPKPKRVLRLLRDAAAVRRQAARAASTRRARGSTLVARQVSLDGPRRSRPMAQALREAAEWVGCTDVRVERASSATRAARAPEPTTLRRRRSRGPGGHRGPVRAEARAGHEAARAGQRISRIFSRIA